MRLIVNKAKSNPKRIAFGEGEEPQVIRAAMQVQDEGIGFPVLLGHRAVIEQRIAELGLDFQPTIISPHERRAVPNFEQYVEAYHRIRERKGVTREMALRLMTGRNYYGAMMVRLGDADAYVSCLQCNYPDVIRPALEIVRTRAGVNKVAGMYIVIPKDQRIFFFTDATVNIDPSAEDLAEIALLASDAVKDFDIGPQVALLSFSNFCSTPHPFAEKTRRAVELVHAQRPELPIDSEMQADTAVVARILEDRYPFARVREPNVLVFPNLESANVAYKLVHHLGDAETIGPILLGMAKPVHVLQQGDEVKDIVNMTAIAVVDAQG